MPLLTHYDEENRIEDLLKTKKNIKCCLKPLVLDTKAAQEIEDFILKERSWG